MSFTQESEEYFHAIGVRALLKNPKSIFHDKILNFAKKFARESEKHLSIFFHFSFPVSLRFSL